MRHVVGFIIGLLLAPVVLIGTGWALPRLTALARAEGASFVSTTGFSAIGVLCVVALLLGLAAAAPRLTPMLSGITGLSLVGVTAMHVLRPGLLDRLPPVPGAEGAQTLLIIGAYLPLGVALAMPLFMSGRWKRYRPAHSENEAEEYFDGLYDEDDDEPERAPRAGRRTSA